MDYSSSDDAELYNAPRDMRTKSMTRPRSYDEVYASTTTSLEKDSQQMLLALYYWRQKLCSKTFQQWRHAVSLSTARQAHRSFHHQSTFYNDHDDHRSSRGRRGTNAILKRQQRMKKTVDEDEDSSDASSEWSFRLDSAHTLRHPTLASSTQQIARQRNAIYQTMQQQDAQRQRMAAIKSRYSLLDQVFSSWKAVVASTRPYRDARKQAALTHWRRRSYRLVWTSWRGFRHRKMESLRARQHAKLLRYQMAFRAWIRFTTVLKSSTFVHSKYEANMQICYWRQWKQVYSMHQKWRVLVFYFTSQRRTKQLNLCWRTWVLCATASRQKTVLTNRALSWRRKSLLRSNFNNWHQAIDIDGPNKTIQLQKNVAETTGVRRWHRWTLRRRQYWDKLQLADVWDASRVSRHIMRRWRAFLLIRAHENHQWQRAILASRRRYLHEFFIKWMETSRRKRHSRDQRIFAEQWHACQCRFRHFSMWKQFKEQREKLRMAVLHFYSVTTENVFRMWRRLVQDILEARWKACEMADINRRNLMVHSFVAWRDMAHRQHYLNLLRCRLQIRFGHSTLRRHLEAWKAFLVPKKHRRRLCATFQSQAMHRSLRFVFLQWRAVVASLHEWRRFICALDQGHDDKRLRFGFHQWRLNSVGLSLAKSFECRWKAVVFMTWITWAQVRKAKYRRVEQAILWWSDRLIEQVLLKWRGHVLRIRSTRNCGTHVRLATQRCCVATHWQYWKLQWNNVRHGATASAWNRRQVLNKVFQAFRQVVATTIQEKKIRRAAQLLLTGRLSTVYFDRWNEYVAQRRYLKDQTALARKHCTTRIVSLAFRAWQGVHSQMQEKVALLAAWTRRQIKVAISHWYNLAQATSTTKWQIEASRSYYRTGLYRKVLYAWEEGAALRHHIKTLQASAFDHMLLFRVEQAIRRLETHASSRKTFKAMNKSAEKLWRKRRMHMVVLNLRSAAEAVGVLRKRFKQAQAWNKTCLLRRVWSALVASTRRSQHVRRMLIDVLGSQSQAKLKSTFHRWQLLMHRQHRLREGIEFANQNSLTRGVCQWRAYTYDSRRIRSLLCVMETVLVGHSANFYFLAWKTYCADRRNKKQLEMAAIAKAKNLLRRHMWKSWCTYVLRQRCLYIALEKRQVHRAQLSWRGWCQFIHQRRMKNAKLELACLHFASKCLRHCWTNWRRAAESIRDEDDKRVAKSHRLRLFRWAWRHWKLFKHKAVLLRRVTLYWKQRHLRLCFRHWNLYRDHRVHYASLVRASNEHYQEHLRRKAWTHWCKLKTLREHKAACLNLAMHYDEKRLCRPCFTTWRSVAHKTKKTKQILAAAFRRDASMCMLRCFRSWQQYSHSVSAKRQTILDHQHAMNDFKMDRCISSWKLYTERTHQLNVLNQRALDFLDQKRRARCFDAWVLHGYVIKEQELKLQLAIDHSNASILRRRFCQWTEFAYWKYQTAQAKYHYHQTLLQQSWIAWLAFLQSRICDEASIELAEIHYREKLRSTAWRKWRLICMHQLQKRIAAHHFANHTLRKAFHEWREHGKVLCRLRHAWIYWEESALGLRFRQWQRFVESCRTRHAQFRLFQSVQQRQAVRRWHRWVEASKHSKQQLSWAASLFYESSLGWYFRAWRSKFVSRVHKRVQTERAISHLMCKGLRGFFERWKSAKVQMKHHREAKTMADYHLELTRQAKGVRYLHDRVVDLRAAQYIWEYVKAFRRHKLYLNGISAWRACAKERKVNKVMECTASRTFDMRILKKTFSHWIMYCSNVRCLKTRVYQSRHVYFSSLSSRAFLRLKRFARLKRQLRSISTRVQLRQRQEWFKRWKRYRVDTQIARKRVARASMLYRRSHLQRLFNHWKSVACERWMRSRLIEYAFVVREQLALLSAIRSWHTMAVERKQSKARGWRLRQTQLVTNTFRLWRRYSNAQQCAKRLKYQIIRHRQTNALRAWFGAFVAKTAIQL